MKTLRRADDSTAEPAFALRPWKPKFQELYVDGGPQSLKDASGQRITADQLPFVPPALGDQATISVSSPVLSANLSTGTSSRWSSVTNKSPRARSAGCRRYRPCFRPIDFPPASTSG